ncbi:MAG: flagellar hook-associated protein FlgK [Marmoricola sp.]
MTGTFGSFNTAVTALRANQVAMDVVNNNVANASTPGYTRRRAELTALGSPSQPALWSRYDGVGGGVDVSAVDRMADPFLDARSRVEHGRQSYLDTRQSVLDRVESGIGEPGDNGVAAAFSTFQAAVQDLANNPGQAAARSQLLSAAGTVADAVRVQASNIDNESSDLRTKLQAQVDEVNTVAADLAATNRNISSAQLAGSETNTLLDKRDQLTERLAELTGATTTLDSLGLAQVSLGGVALVSGQSASTFAIASGVTASGAADGSPVTFTVTPPATPPAVATPVAIDETGMTGEIGAVAQLLNVTLPAYRSGLDAVAKTFADQMNAVQLGTASAPVYDLAGNVSSKPLFSYTAGNVSGTLSVALDDPNALAASALPGGALDGSNAAKMAGYTAADDAYQKLVNGFGSQVASSQRLAANQQALTSQVDNAREQLGGVNIDEETVNLIAAQRAYQAASRVISTIDTILDTIINRMGVG